MWIQEALTDLPRGGNTVLAGLRLRTIALVLAAWDLGVIIDRWIAGDIAWLWLRLLAFVLLVGLAAWSGGVAEALPGRIQAREEAQWRRRIVAGAMAGTLVSTPARPGRPGGGHPGARRRSGEGAVIDAATTGAEKTAAYRASFLAPTLASFTSPVLVLVGWGFAIDWLSAVILAVFVALVPPLIVFAGRRLRGSNHRYRAEESAATERYLEMIEGLGTFAVLGAAGRARDAFAVSARAAMRTLAGLLARNQRMIAVNDLLFGFLMTGAALALLLWRLDTGAISAGQAFAGLLLTVLLAEPIDRVGRSFYVGLAGRARRDGILAMLGHTDQPPADAAPAATGSDAPPAISLRGVNVTLGGRRILEDIDLDVPAGAQVAIVGPTGAGKTTLLRVLAGLQEADGRIILADHDADPAALRAATTVVSQRAGILSTTIGEDLRLAAPDASDAELRAAAARAHLDLDAFPQGLDTPVGDRGAHFSGGQRRRLLIARALLRPRPLLLLDEPTADLDRRTEAAVRDTLAREAAGRTVVQIVHRLDMLDGVDLVLVLEDGRITQAGAPAQLAAEPGYLRDALAAEGAR